MMPGMWLGTILWILLLVILTWLNRSFGRLQSTPNTPQPPYSYRGYEQGYHASPSLLDRYHEGERSAQPKQEFDQPYVPYPQEQEMPPQF